mgnify:CR=1 FL=1
MQFKRTCQECGHEQPDKQPVGEPSVAYCNRKCKRCHSESLDYGSEKMSQEEFERFVDADNELD